MRTDHPLPHRTTTVPSDSHHRSRALLTALALVVLAPLALAGALFAVGVAAATGPIGAGVAALLVLSAPVTVPYLAVRGVTAAFDRGRL